MRDLTRALRWPLSVATALVLFASHGLVAQEMEEDEQQSYWYVSAYQIPWERVDSLQTLVSQYTNQVVERSREAGRILDYKILIHHTADEYNVVIMRHYPSWSAIDAGAGFDEFAEELWDEEQRTQIEDGFNWVYEGASAHKDGIYTEATGGD